MPATSEQQHLAALHTRLQDSREEIFTLAHELAGDRPPTPASEEAFPRSRLVRSLLSHRGRMFLGAAALALTLLRPKMIWRVLRFGPVLRPLFMRYLLPRMLGQR